ncbi:MAG: phasin family protein [Methylobacteriaceae bacterium]|nr:phasin family protein [Methylobacteriaceae bacterium]
MFTNFEELQKLSKEQMEAATAAAASVTKGFQTIAAETSEYSKRSLENGSAYLEKLLSARKIEDAVQIQQDFAKTSYEGFVAQATRMGELYATLAREAFRPIESAVAKTQAAGR